MKKILVTVLTFALALSVFAGGTKDAGKVAANSKPNKDNIKVGFVYIGSIHDEGYTQAHDKGRLALEQMGSKPPMWKTSPRTPTARRLSVTSSIRVVM